MNPPTLSSTPTPSNDDPQDTRPPPQIPAPRAPSPAAPGAITSSPSPSPPSTPPAPARPQASRVAHLAALDPAASDAYLPVGAPPLQQPSQSAQKGILWSACGVQPATAPPSAQSPQATPDLSSSPSSKMPSAKLPASPPRPSSAQRLQLAAQRRQDRLAHAQAARDKHHAHVRAVHERSAAKAAQAAELTRAALRTKLDRATDLRAAAVESKRATAAALVAAASRHLAKYHPPSDPADPVRPPLPQHASCLTPVHPNALQPPPLATDKSQAARIIFKAMVNWRLTRAAKTLVAEAPYLGMWGDTKEYSCKPELDNRPYTVGTFATFSTRAASHHWMERAIQTPHLLTLSERFAAIFLHSTRGAPPPPSSSDRPQSRTAARPTPPPMAPRILLLAFLFSHHGSLIGVGPHVAAAAERLGRSVEAVLAAPTRRVFHMCLFVDYVYFYWQFGRWKIHDYEALTHSLADTVALGVRQYSRTAQAACQRGTVPAAEAREVLTGLYTQHFANFRSLVYLTGTDAARALVYSELAQSGFLESLATVLQQHGYPTLELIAHSIEAGDAPVAPGAPTSRDVLGIRHSHMRAYAFQTLIDGHFLLGYAWTRSTLYDPAAYTDSRHPAELMKQQLKDGGCAKEVDDGSSFVVAVVGYFADSVAALVESYGQDAEALRVDKELVRQQVAAGTFDARVHFDALLEVLVQNGATNRADRARLLRNVQRRVYRGLRPGAAQSSMFQSLVPLVDLLEVLHVDAINLTLAHNRDEVAKMAALVELAAFVEDLRGGKRMNVLERWAREEAAVHGAPGLVTAVEKARALETRFYRFMAEFKVDKSTGNVDLAEMPEVFAQCRRLVVDYKLELRDIAVASAVFTSVVFLLGGRAARLVDLGALKRALVEAVRADGDLHGHGVGERLGVAKYVAKVCNAVVGGINAGARAAEVCELVAPSGVLLPEYSVSGVMAAQDGADGACGIYWHTGEESYGVVCGGEEKLCADLRTVHNPRQWLVRRVWGAVRRGSDDAMVRAAARVLEEQMRGGSESKGVRMFEEESAVAVGHARRLWRVVSGTYAPVLEAVYRDARLWREPQQSKRAT